MLAVIAAVAAFGALSEQQRECVAGLNAYLKAEGVGCYYGTQNAQLAALESFFEGIVTHCDLRDCRCSANATDSAICDAVATASLVGYINIHSNSASVNLLYEDMKRILYNTCREETNEGIPSSPLLAPSYGACGADNAVSAHTGGIGAYVGVYAALFALVMLESLEETRYEAVPMATIEPFSVEKGGVKETKDFL